MDPNTTGFDQLGDGGPSDRLVKLSRIEESAILPDGPIRMD
ncbi:hypothetical protein [Enterovirga rhinocerotis]|nr:hypothetical protein [Enterovirga rhinocerotis]